ncbi:hypothetical protein LPJ61_003780 [Coemansia biformis]|uniref:FAM50A/XAP5 C-terminal domain-containing protein n=1 Tax=Coemansia biformis TaxID=1286918 RepID=A0A9W7YBX7_9FUNG|nr:hypothetical protein LPJ61_003780 [Coemansia biformis]
MAGRQQSDGGRKSSRDDYLQRQRERLREDARRQREKPPRGNEKATSAPTSRLPKEESVENKLKLSTIGLVELEEFQRIKGELEEERLREAAKTMVREQTSGRSSSGGSSDQTKTKAEAADGSGKKKGADGKTGRRKAVLSFDDGDDDGSGGGGDDEILMKKARKNPAVDTSFLPDKEREEEEARLREELRQKWLRDQEAIKQEPITITYSYWDGSGHRKQVRCKKGDTIAQFLDKCKAQVPELRTSSADGLVYIKEDLVIPHHYTFYDFIVNKARGKSGPLFSFDVHDDVRLTQDARVEKDDSHAGKVCERSWYERNKHIFPANRWEVFDPEKNYGTYTIRDTRKARAK